jgi:hypothetical protein
MSNGEAPGPDVIAALVTLNSHARAYGCGKRAIYAYKTLVCGPLIAAGRATVCLRQWAGVCDHCRGTGQYVDSYGERWPHCRRCANTGRVTLKFVETELLGGPTWHCPFDYHGGGRYLAELARAAMWDGEKGRWMDREGNDPIFWNVANGWTPKQPGEKLIPDDAATALNTVEAWVLTQRPTPFTWCAPVCAEHAKIPVALWPAKDELPAWVVTPPLAEWRMRHERLGFERPEWD